jgi:outer membrane protein OmpA-like peptidoglycan-associated protein
MSRGFRNMKRYSAHIHEEEKESFWVSYTDLMSALLIIFALVLIVTLFDTQSVFEKAKDAMDQTAIAIKEKEAAIDEKNKMIEEVIGIKTSIINELLAAFKESNLELQIDPQTGAIRFAGGVFFETNSSTISSSGLEYLKQFIPQYIKILLSDRFRDSISQIIVEGHTDTVGTYLFNLKLSQDRALSVVQQVFAPSFPDFKFKEELKVVITANGRSFSLPIRKENGEIDGNKSRRVEFKFRLKDEQLLDKLQGVVKESGE